MTASKGGIEGEIKQFAETLGADLLGVTSAASLAQVPEGGPVRGYAPTDLLPDARSVIVVGKRVLRTSLRKGYGSAIAYLMTHLNIKLNEIAYELAKRLEDAGHEALPVFFNAMIFRAPQVGVDTPSGGTTRYFSYTRAAAQAGLGQVGLSRLLVTPEYGPRVRWMTVITDLDLAPDGPAEETHCRPEECGFRCAEVCPVQAIEEDGTYHWQKCIREISKFQEILGYASCARCMAVCPVLGGW